MASMTRQSCSIFDHVGLLGKSLVLIIFIDMWLESRPAHTKTSIEVTAMARYELEYILLKY
jgi:hypothetical protein